MKHNHPPKLHNFKKVKDKPGVRDKFLTQVHHWDARKTDKKLKSCPICKLVWEVIKSENKERCEYYSDFPSYGKLKVICDRCV